MTVVPPAPLHSASFASVVRPSRPAAVAGLAVALVGAFVLLGWALDVEPLKSLVPGMIVMIPYTAVGFVLAGLSLWLQRHEGMPAGTTRLARALEAAVLAIGLVMFAERVFGWDLGVDLLLFPNAVQRYPYRPPGLMATNSAVCFSLAGAALLLIDVETRRGRRPSQVLAAIGLAIATLALVGYLYGARPLYAIDRAAGMALITALSFAVLHLGILFARPTRGGVALVTGPGMTGVLVRRLLPATILVPLVLGWLWIRGRQLELFSREGGVSIFVLATMAVLVMLVLRSANVLRRSDREREAVLEREAAARAEAEQLAEELQTQAAELEQQTEEAQAAAEAAEQSSLRAMEAAAEAERARAAAEESEQRFRNAADTAPVLIWTSGTDALCDWFNQPWLDFTGRTMEQELGDGWAEGVHADDLQRRLNVYLSSFEARRPFTMEYRLHRYDGQYRWVLDDGMPRFEANGAFVGYIGSCIDITDRKVAEGRSARLQAATEAFASALTPEEIAQLIVREGAAAMDAHSGIAALVDEEGASLRLVGALNMGVAFVEGLTRLPIGQPTPLGDAVRSRRPVVLARPADIAGQYPDVAAALAQEGVRASIAVPLVTRGNSLGALMLRFNYPRDFPPQDVELVLALARIATEALERARLYDAERQARADAEAASRAKSDFLAVMSHELRTPLNAIIGYGDLLADGVTGPVTPAQQRQLSRIKVSAAHLVGLIDEILTLSRLDAGREDVYPEPIDVAKALDDAAAMAVPLADAKGLEFHVRPPAERLLIESDPAKLRQILVNLLSNAVKFTERGEVELRASVDGNAVCFEVRDTGIGIAEDHLERVFDEFWQVEQPTTRRASGSGLGLSVSRRLAHILSGDISVESRVGQGSTFSLRLPRRWQAPEENEPGSAAGPGPSRA